MVPAWAKEVCLELASAAAIAGESLESVADALRLLQERLNTSEG